ncbi:hypothetical protein N8468_03315 [Planktomarina temperata]|nr:hypothetical protein [Planktomarina temperata]
MERTTTNLDTGLRLFIFALAPYELASWYVPGTGIPFSIISIIFVIYFFSREPIHKGYIDFVSLLILVACITFPTSIYWSSHLSLGLRLNSFISIINGALLFVFIGQMIRRYHQETFTFALKYILIFSVFMFYIQLLSFMIFGVHTDYFELFGLGNQRLAGHERELSAGLVFRRFSGLYAEPAVYAYVTNILLTGLLFQKSISTNLFVISLSSVWLSLSASGIAFSIFPILIFLLSRKKNRYLRIFIFVFIATALSGVFQDIFGQQIYRIINFLDDPSGVDRLSFAGYLRENEAVFLLGYGLFLDARLIVPASGFVTSLIFTFGFIFSMILIMLLLMFIFRQLAFIRACVFFFLVVLNGYYVSSPFFWFSFSALFFTLHQPKLLGIYLITDSSHRRNTTHVFSN